MNHLLRSLAPISDEVWKFLDEEARQRATVALAARRLVDFSGPYGWQHSATNLGRTDVVGSPPVEGVSVRQRVVLPLVELRAAFSISLAELQDFDRGARDIDVRELDKAAHQVAVAENTVVFNGWQGTVRGMGQASPYPPAHLGGTVNEYPSRVAAAVGLLRENGVGGPYGLALGPEQHRVVLETAEHGGYPLFEHLAKIVDGPIVWAPGLRGAAIVSLRGGDFLFESGQDLSIGYDSHDREVVRFYLEESFSFRVTTPEASALVQA